VDPFGFAQETIPKLKGEAHSSKENANGRKSFAAGKRERDRQWGTLCYRSPEDDGRLEVARRKGKKHKRGREKKARGKAGQRWDVKVEVPISTWGVGSAGGSGAA